MADLDLNLYIGADVIKPVSVVRDLGVFEFLDSELSMHHHINTVVRSCFFHLRRLKSVRRILGAEVSAFVTTRLDYCNSVFAGLPQSTIDPLQRVQNAAARLVARTGTRDHITPVLPSLHCWCRWSATLQPLFNWRHGIAESEYVLLYWRHPALDAQQSPSSELIEDWSYLAGFRKETDRQLHWASHHLREHCSTHPVSQEPRCNLRLLNVVR